jgi:ketosteroid isomerase-like protein
VRVLHPQAGAAALPDAISRERDRLIAVGTTRRADPATGRLIVARFRHVWRVRDGRVVSVHRTDDGPDLAASDGCGPEPC